MERQKNHSSVMLQRLAELVIRPISCGDTRYHTKMRSRSGEGPKNAAPTNNKEFFQKAYKVLEKEVWYGKVFGKLTFAFQSPQNDVPAGSFLHVSSVGLNMCHKDEDFLASCNDPKVPTKREYLDYFKPKAQLFKSIVTKGMLWFRGADRDKRNFDI